MDAGELAESISYCGLICRLCHLAQACEGCRGTANACENAKKTTGCHQHQCCMERGYTGCWECPDFPCGQDMFSDTHDVRLRAFVRCVREEGLSALAAYVLSNEAKGIHYGHMQDYDGLGSEEAVLTLLRLGKKAV